MSQQMRPLDPASIDDFIESARAEGPTRSDPDVRLVRSLHSAYTLPAASRAAVLERVHERLLAEVTSPTPAPTGSARPDGSTVRFVRPIATTQSPRRERPVNRARSGFGAIAAVLVVALLAGAFYAVTQGREKKGGTSPTATTTSAPGPIGVWQDVAISSANTGGKLDFDPNKGVAYSVAASNGAVYACGSGHLWYSQDGGAHYTPFSPALPSSFASGISGACTMTTVQGWPGLFIAANNSPDGRSTLYAAPGDGSWQKLLMSGVALPAGGGGSQGQVVGGGQIWADLFNSANFESITPPVQASRDWLYFVSATNGATDLVGTNDFGQTWMDVSAADTVSPCAHFAVSPNNPFYLACQPSSAGGVTESVDGGKTWTSLGEGIGSILYLVGMSDHTIYTTYANPAYTEHVVTSDVKTYVWNDQGSVYAVNMGGPEVVASDGTVYFPVLDDKTASQLSVYTYSPGSQGLKQILNPTALPGAKGGIRAFGGIWPGATPAVYSIETPAHTGPTLVYRLFLPTAGSGPTATQPAATPSATAIGDTPCTQAVGSPGNIPAGAVGADLSTFVSRWGKRDGVAAGSTYYGPITSQGVPEVQVPNGYSRAYELFYTVNQAHKMAPTEAMTLAESLLPADATPMGQPQSIIDQQAGGEEIVQLYCSAAYLAVAPPSGQTTTYPVARNGVIRVTYRLGQVGNVQLITFEPVQ